MIIEKLTSSEGCSFNIINSLFEIKQWITFIYFNTITEIIMLNYTNWCTLKIQFYKILR